jgi:hypothetical protein
MYKANVRIPGFNCNDFHLPICECFFLDDNIEMAVSNEDRFSDDDDDAAENSAFAAQPAINIPGAQSKNYYFFLIWD